MPSSPRPQWLPELMAGSIPSNAANLLGFLNRNGFLAVFTREEVLDAFEDRTRQLAERCGAEVAIGRLRRLAGRSLARLVVDAGTHIAPRTAVFTPVNCTPWSSFASRSAGTSNLGRLR